MGISLSANSTGDIIKKTPFPVWAIILIVIFGVLLLGIGAFFGYKSYKKKQANKTERKSSYDLLKEDNLEQERVTEARDA
jgi:predicted negative regulator of RcsB-dependent stress response